MQPYQEASEETRRQGEMPINALKQAGSLVATAGVGGLALNKVLPFLNNFIPQDIAIKGLSKIDPRFGKFIKKAMSNGTAFEEIKEFIKGKTEEGNKKNKSPQNIIEENSPELHEILADKIGQGLKPLAVAYQVAKDGKFSRQIADLQKKTGQSFTDIVSSVFGGGEEKKPLSPQENQIINAPNQQTVNSTQNQQSQSNNGDEALMAALDKILKM